MEYHRDSHDPCPQTVYNRKDEIHKWVDHKSRVYFVLYGIRKVQYTCYLIFSKTSIMSHYLRTILWNLDKPSLNQSSLSIKRVCKLQLQSLSLHTMCRSFALLIFLPEIISHLLPADLFPTHQNRSMINSMSSDFHVPCSTSFSRLISVTSPSHFLFYSLSYYYFFSFF